MMLLCENGKSTVNGIICVSVDIFSFLILSISHVNICVCYILS